MRKKIFDEDVPQIKELLSCGNTVAEVARILSNEKGMFISAHTVTDHLRKGKRVLGTNKLYAYMPPYIKCNECKRTLKKHHKCSHCQMLLHGNEVCVCANPIKSPYLIDNLLALLEEVFSGKRRST